MEILASIAGLAVFVERVVEMLFGKIVGMKPYLPFIALAGGIALALFGGIDGTPILKEAGIQIDLNPWVARVMTGIVIGGGSSLAHQAFTKFIPGKS